MEAPGEIFRRIRVNGLVLSALCEGLGRIIDRNGDGTTDCELIGAAQTEFNCVITDYAVQLCEALSDAETLGIMDALEIAAWGLPRVVIEGAE